MDASSLILPLSKWQHKARRQTRDALPTPLITEISPNDASGDQTAIASAIDEDRIENRTTNDSETGVCAVCQKHESRYHCPKCQLPYCTVECYKVHSSPLSESSSATTVSACTEAFYKNRVSEILELEISEKQGTTRQILNRHHHNQNDMESNFHSGESKVSDIELYELLHALEEQNEYNGNESGGERDPTSVEHLQSLLSPSLRTAFESALISGELSNLFLKRWSPWWKTELVGSNNDNNNDCDVETKAETVFEGSLFHGGRTLDERLLEIPPFTTLYKNGSSPPNLLYNLLDIVYGMAWNLRLYLGAANALNSPLESFDTLISSSLVLGKDARYTTLEEVLINCTARSMRHYPSSGCNAHWTTLSGDVAVLTSSHRHIGRCFFEAIDIVSASIGWLKKKRRTNYDADEKRDKKIKENELVGQIKQMRRIRKKLEFYISWSQYYFNQQPLKNSYAADLQSEIGAWIDHWKLSNPHDSSSELNSLVLPTNKPLTSGLSTEGVKKLNRSMYLS